MTFWAVAGGGCILDLGVCSVGGPGLFILTRLRSHLRRVKRHGVILMMILEGGFGFGHLDAGVDEIGGALQTVLQVCA